ncbi:MAG: oxidoreductase [Betaproteobacteria bacterium RIFCSPHIGHO2_12_FULL_69_13]|nr:MAG: oxidoreductase [Betaproteobacteria bacterium RIFCSPHIGHO2_12_FULL_69_13]OGA66944.1 MAG: oxidoreductase [Betaproteobacteria bacterium RIFCSPLOWO2_12_FULL_68_20]
MRVAIVGLGMAVTPHAKSLLDLSGRVEVAYAFSPSRERREKFGDRFPFPRCDSLETILEDASVGTLALLTPPNTHLELVRRCAEAGKHVLLEKPLETSTARAEQLVETCRRAKVKLGVVFQNRHKPAARRLLGALASGELGTLAGASAYVHLWRPQSYYDEPGRGTRARDGGGVLLTQGIHTLDVLLSLAGEPQEVRSFSATTPVHRMETEDLVCAAVRWKSGALGVVEATTSAYPGTPERIGLVAERGTATLAGTLAEIRWHDGRKETAGGEGSAGGSGADPMAFPHDFHRAVWSDFLDAVESGREPLVNGEEALRVHRFIDTLLGV